MESKGEWISGRMWDEAVGGRPLKWRQFRNVGSPFPSDGLHTAEEGNQPQRCGNLQTLDLPAGRLFG